MLKYLKPYDIGVKKVRLGPSTPGEHNHGDGGYVTPENILLEASSLVTYGVAGDIRYEQDFQKKYNKTAYLFDHTVDHPREPSPGLLFTKEGLGNQPNCKEFLTHYREHNIKGNVMLKIDIEGGEFDYFSQTDIAGMSLVTTGLILEVHWLQEKTNQEKFVTMMERLKEFYVLTHVHGNNWGDTFDYIEKVSGSKFTGYIVPRVLELTFANKRFVNYMVPDTQKYPIEGLDLPNNAYPGKVDCNLDFLNDL